MADAKNRRSLRRTKLFLGCVLKLTPERQKKLIRSTVRAFLSKKFTGSALMTTLKHLLGNKPLVIAQTYAMKADESMAMQERCLTDNLREACTVCFSYKATICVEGCKHNHVSLCAACQSETCLICEPCTEEAKEEEYPYVEVNDALNPALTS
jgi:hypothetical protein